MNKESGVDKEFLTLVISHIDDPVFVKDINHVWVLCNPSFCQFMGRSEEELIGKTDHDFLNKEQADLFWEKDNEVFNTGEVNTNYEYNTGGDNVVRYVRTKKTLFTTSTGAKYLVGVVTDITEEKKAKDGLIKSEERAVEANKAKSRFLANMSHEIRTPLYSIIGFTDLLLQEEKDPNKNELLSAIRSSGSVLLNTINDVLDISKIEEGKATIHNNNFALKKLIKQETKRFEPLLKKNNNVLKVTMDEGIAAFFFSDDMKLRQILNNLLSNANKFTKNGTIHLEVKRTTITNSQHKQSLKFTVRDTGVGIKKEFIPKLFENFSQQDSSKTKEYAGTGLGLYIVHSFVNLLEGTMEVHSMEGEGTSISFDLSLPVTTGTNHHKHLKAVNFELLGRTTILIAEDNPLNQLLIKKILSVKNLELEVVNNGKEAFEAAAAKQYDLILMDIQMPVMDGYQACAAIRTLPQYADTPIIALTANVVTEDIKAVEEAGMHYMSKPFDLHEFFEKLEEVKAEAIKKQ